MPSPHEDVFMRLVLVRDDKDYYAAPGAPTLAVSDVQRGYFQCPKCGYVGRANVPGPAPECWCGMALL